MPNKLTTIFSIKIQFWAKELTLLSTWVMIKMMISLLVRSKN